MAEPSYYELLGVEPDADQDQIKAAFRNQVKRNHPDTGGNPTLFRMIESAYSTLSDESARRDYDTSIGRQPAGDAFAGATSSTKSANSQQGESAGHRDEERPTGQWDRDPDWEDWVDWREEEATRANTQSRDNSSEQSVDDPDAAGSPFRSNSYSEPSRQVMPDMAFLRMGVSNLVKSEPFRIALLWAVLLWVVVALILGLQVIPGINNVAVFTYVVLFGLAWWAGSFVLRALGWLFLIVALWSSQRNDADAVETAFQVAFAFCVWLSGHWLHAFKNGEWRSFLAEAILDKLPGPLNPMWRHDRRQHKMLSDEGLRN